MNFLRGLRLFRSLGMLGIIVVRSVGRILRWGGFLRKLSGLGKGRSRFCDFLARDLFVVDAVFDFWGANVYKVSLVFCGMREIYYG